MTRLRYPAVLLACAIGGGLPPIAQAGLVVYGTRFVLTPDAPVVGVTVENSGSQTYLLSSKVEPDAGNNASSRLPPQLGGLPLVVTPPLVPLRGGRINQLRLVCSGCEALPSDRESVYWLGIAAIPAGKPPPNTVQIALRQRFKVFYRPASLSAAAAQQAYTRLTWSRQTGQVSVINPTPYYVTLFRVQVNGREVTDAGMVPPFSTRTQPWCVRGTDPCVIQWRTLDDNSGVRPAWQVTPVRGEPVTGQTVARGQSQKNDRP